METTFNRHQLLTECSSLKQTCMEMNATACEELVKKGLHCMTTLELQRVKSRLKNLKQSLQERPERTYVMLSVDDVYRDMKINVNGNKHLYPYPAMTPVVMHAGSFLKHTLIDDDHKHFEGDFPTNKFTFFSYSRHKVPDSYWGEEHPVSFTYQTVRPLVLVVLPQFKLHDLLGNEVEPDLFEEIPWGTDKSFPYADDGFAWDYIEAELLCKVFGVDGVVRTDEIILCGPYNSKIEPVHISDAPYTPYDPEWNPFFELGTRLANQLKEEPWVSQYRTLFRRVKDIVS